MPATTLDAVERRLRALGCGDAVADLHILVGVDPRFMFPHSLSVHRSCDPGPCDDLLLVLDGHLRRSPRLARALILRGRLLRVLGRKEEALAAFDRAVELAPRDARALRWRAELLLHMEGQAVRSVDALTAALNAAPHSPWPSVFAAAALLSKGASPEVFTALDAALDSVPRHIPALLLRAVAHERCSRFDLAATDAALAARLAPACVGALVLRGRLEARLGRREAAAASFAAATHLEPDAKAFYAAIVTADQPLGKGVCELKQLDDYIRNHPAASWAYALRGDMLRADHGQGERGISDLKRAVQLDPKTPWIRACLARSQVQLQHSKEGIRNLRAAIARDPRCGWLHSWLAESYRQFNRPEDALRVFRRAIALNPRFPQVHVWLGRMHGDLGRWKLALEEFTRAVRLDCGYGFAYAKRSDALARLGRHAEALPDFERALQLESTSHNPAWIRTMRDESLRALPQKTLS